MNCFDYVEIAAITNPQGVRCSVRANSLKELLRDGPRPGAIELHRLPGSNLWISCWLRQARTVQDLQRAEKAVEGKLAGDVNALDALLKLHHSNNNNLTLDLHGVSSVKVLSYSEFIYHFNLAVGVPARIRRYVYWDQYVKDQVKESGNVYELGGLYYVFEA